MVTAVARQTSTANCLPGQLYSRQVSAAADGAVFVPQVSGSNIEVGIIGTDKTFKVLSEAEVQDYLQEVE
jgi:hypothetical protein